jgi:hypothetical protein
MKKPKPAAKEKAATSERYEPTPKERTVLTAYIAKTKEVALLPRLKVDGIAISPDHPDPEVGGRLLAHALGTTDNDFLNGIVSQLAIVTCRGNKEFDERQLNFMLATVAGVRPQDEIEAMLATQMAAVHMATMTFARRLSQVDTIQQQDSAERAFNKLTRTFTTQMQALKNYRSTGQQKVTVEHVTVHPGGQAIVGNVSHGAPKSDAGQNLSVALPALSPPVETPMPLPVGGGVEQKKVRAIP